MRIPRLLALTLSLAACASSAPRLTLDPSAAYRAAASCEVSTLEVSWRDEARNRDVPALVYLPRCAGSHPVIVFSHGLANSRRGYRFLGESWASHGYVVVHLQHHGSDDELLSKHGPLALFRASGDRTQWRDRPLDISFAIDQLERIERGGATPAEMPLKGQLDLTRIGVAGHSYGAFTALAVAGMTIEFGDGTEPRSFLDRRVRSIVALSTPRLHVVKRPDAFDAIRIPVLHMTGTRDSSLIFRTHPSDRLVPFQRIANASQELVILNDAGHSSFSDDERRPSVNRALHVDAMQTFTLAFWDATLRGDERAKSWLQNDATRYLDRLGVVRTK